MEPWRSSRAVAAGRIVADGAPSVLKTLVGYLDEPDPNVAIVTP